jgi:hypothetical protein
LHPDRTWTTSGNRDVMAALFGFHRKQKSIAPSEWGDA